MTNLQKLLSVLNLNEDIKSKTIVDNFNNQDNDKFFIDEGIYKLYTRNEVEDILFDDYENKFCDFTDNLYKCEYSSLFSRIVERLESNILSQAVENSDGEEIPNHIFIDVVDDLYIYEYIE